MNVFEKITSVFKGGKQAEWSTVIRSIYDNHPAKMSKHPRMQLAYAFFRGEQYMKWDETTGTIIDVTVTRETKSVYNFCSVFAKLYPAKMLKDMPIPFANPYPTNTEGNDEKTSAISNAAWRWWWSQQKMKTKLFEHLKWASVTGLGVSKELWNKRAGEKIVDDPSGGIFKGEVDFDVLNPMNFFPDPDATKQEEMMWAMDVRPYPKLLLEQMYGVRELQSDSRGDLANYRLSVTKNIDNYKFQETDTPICLVFDFWAKGTPANPNGKHLIVAGGKVLAEEDNPEPDLLPYKVTAVNKPMDDFFGLGYVWPLIHLQRDSNMANSLSQENMRYMSAIKWRVSPNDDIEENSFNSEPGELIKSDSAMPLQPVALPQHLVQRPGLNLEMAKFITGMQDAGMGIMGKHFNQTSGVAITELKSSEDVSFSEDVEIVKEFIRDVALTYLRLAKKYYIEERMVCIVGKNKKADVYHFTGTDFVNNYDIDAQVGGGFSLSQQDRYTQYLSLLQAGIFEKAGIDPKFVLREVFRIGNMDKVDEQQYLDERQAKRSLEKILRGENPIVSRYADYGVFIKVFTDYTKTAEYDELEDMMKLTIDENIKIYKQLFMENMLLAAKEQMAMQQQLIAGMPPPPAVPMPNPPKGNTPGEQQRSRDNLRMAEGRPPTEGSDQSGQPEVAGGNR